MLKVATILTSDTPCFYLNVKFFIKSKARVLFFKNRLKFVKL